MPPCRPWPLCNSVYPVPAYPGNPWPYLVAMYLVVGVALLVARPGMGQLSVTGMELSGPE